MLKILPHTCYKLLQVNGYKMITLGSTPFSKEVSSIQEFKNGDRTDDKRYAACF